MTRQEPHLIPITVGMDSLSEVDLLVMVTYDTDTTHTTNSMSVVKSSTLKLDIPLTYLSEQILITNASSFALRAATMSSQSVVTHVFAIHIAIERVRGCSAEAPTEGLSNHGSLALLRAIQRPGASPENERAETIKIYYPYNGRHGQACQG